MILLNYGRNLERKINVGGDSVSHDFELTVWRNESNGSVSIKSAESHTLMELDIVNLDTLSLFGSRDSAVTSVVFVLKQLIIYTKFAFRHSR